MADPILELIGITKLFPGIVANDAVDFDLRPGEIHALLGENGAGKSTLMNVLTGLYQPDGGQITVGNRIMRFTSPAQAIAAGIGMVHQHFKLIGAFSVAENIHLGWKETPRYVSPKILEARTRDLAARFNLAVRPEAHIGDLSAGEQQRVEILRVLSRGARMLILDEPTAVLTPIESHELFRFLADFKARNGAVIFISHKLEEVLTISDRISVMRAGRKVATKAAAECDHALLANLMIGRDLAPRPRQKPAPAARKDEPVLTLENVSALDDRGVRVLDRVTLTLHAGEILGIAGVAGNGQRALSEVMAGMRGIAEGTIAIRGRAVSAGSPAPFLEAGIGHIPENRLRNGVAPSLSVADNALLREYRAVGASRARAAEIVAAAEVRVPSLSMAIRNLSGGNQQRLVARREMRVAHTALIAAYPTRGLDIGAIATMLDYLREMRGAGAGVILISEEIEELLAIADRIQVLYAGRIMGEDTDLERIGLMMGGKAAPAR